MPIDTHAHYVPPQLLAAVAAHGAAIGVTLRGGPTPAVAFDYGFATRPLFPRLIEPTADRRAWLAAQGIDRQLVGTWPDMFGYGLAPEPAALWHRMLNDTLAEWCDGEADAFSWLASLPLPDPAGSAAELERVANLGAVGAILPANIEGVNIGEIPLDQLWAAAERLRMPVMIHPVMTLPTPRAARFALAQTTQYTFDTTLGLGSLLATGVLDRFPALRLLGAHGGGALPWLIGRFDIMHSRAPHAAQGILARRLPSEDLAALYLDTIVHHPAALRFLREAVGIDRLVLGSDLSFPPADLTPLASLRAAGLDPAAIRAVADENPRNLFERLIG